MICWPSSQPGANGGAEEIDVLHYLEGEHSLQFLPSIVSKLGRLRPRPRIVATFHQPPELLDRLININNVQQVDHVIVLSPEQVSYFEQYLPADKVSMILHGVDTDFFCPANQSEAPRGFRCLSVGSWLRDYDAVLEVAHRLSSVPDFEFQIVSSAVTDHEIPGNVSVQSGIDDDALRAMYQQADVLFLPVTSATANNAVLEGIACGLPVVTTDLALAALLPARSGSHLDQGQRSGAPSGSTAQTLPQSRVANMRWPKRRGAVHLISLGHKSHTNTPACTKSWSLDRAAAR